MRLLKIILVVFLLCSMNTQAFAGWFSGSSKPLTAEVSINSPAVCKAIDKNISSNIQELVRQVEAGKIRQGSTEAKVAFGKAYVQGYEKEGYSLDETLTYCFSQTDMNFWANFYRYYGDSLNFFLTGLEEPNLQKALLDGGIITDKTIRAYANYQKLK
ncbi:hypothetical protein [Maridesulfovibrio sp.]|uniref:hypothetical protein n=1 Tax=Maridesulfovibrio sp. TaxID=2795000 RepID=UPI0039F0DBD7